jgi:sugar phosphate isomerase/epimerase
MTGPATLLGAAGKKIPIGVQLASLRTEKFTMANFPGLLAAFKKMGYEGVEFAFYITGYYDTDIGTLRKALDDEGMKCCGIHLELTSLLSNAIQRTIESSQILGSPYLIAANLPANNTGTIDGYAESGKYFSKIAEQLKPHQIRVGYHCHLEEFRSMDGRVPWHAFADNSNKDVVLQLDVGHCARGGGDPVAELRKYPGRGYTVHVRDIDPKNNTPIAVGEGTLKLAEVVKACETVAGTEWYIIEVSGMPAIERSIRTFKKLLA